jgi:hypothetical protein
MNEYITTQNTLLPTNIVYDKPELSKDNKYIISKMWSYKNNTKKSLFFQTPLTEVIKLSSNNSLIFALNTKCNKLFEQIDAHTISFLKTSNTLAKFELNNPMYNSIVESYENEEPHNIDVVNISLSGKSIKYYLNEESVEIQETEAKKLLSMKGTKIRTILEFDGIIINKKKSIIFTNIKIRQIQIMYIEPKKIELVECSFIGSDNDEENNNHFIRSNKSLSVNKQQLVIDKRHSIQQPVIEQQQSVIEQQQPVIEQQQPVIEQQHINKNKLKNTQECVSTINKQTNISKKGRKLKNTLPESIFDMSNFVKESETGIETNTNFVKESETGTNTNTNTNFVKESGIETNTNFFKESETGTNTNKNTVTTIDTNTDSVISNLDVISERDLNNIFD